MNPMECSSRICGGRGLVHLQLPRWDNGAVSALTWLTTSCPCELAGVQLLDGLPAMAKTLRAWTKSGPQADHRRLLGEENGLALPNPVKAARCLIYNRQLDLAGLHGCSEEVRDLYIAGASVEWARVSGAGLTLMPMSGP